MNGVIPDGLRMDSHSPALRGVTETAGPRMQVTGAKLEPVVGFEPTILPFTRRRYVVRLRAAPILPRPRVPQRCRSHQPYSARSCCSGPLQEYRSLAMRTPKGLPQPTEGKQP